jgi:hypothetical protein
VRSQPAQTVSDSSRTKALTVNLMAGCISIRAARFRTGEERHCVRRAGIWTVPAHHKGEVADPLQSDLPIVGMLWW